MNNAEWIIKTGHTFKQLRLIQHNELTNRSYTVMLCDEPIAELKDKKEPLDVFRKWLDTEHVEPILDDVEKEYLSAVIKPFRDRVAYIVKADTGDKRGYCHIRVGFLNASDDIYLPSFHESTMYNGMKNGYAYSLEELGI